MATKQMIILAKYLNMRKGKMVAQGGHASMAALINTGKVVTVDNQNIVGSSDGEGDRFFMIPMDADIEQWITGSFRKICTGIDNEADLIKLYEDAKAAGLHASLIVDSGLTEFGGVPTITAVGIGPNEDSKIDALTGKDSDLYKSGKLSLM